MKKRMACECAWLGELRCAGSSAHPVLPTDWGWRSTVLPLRMAPSALPPHLPPPQAAGPRLQQPLCPTRTLAACSVSTAPVHPGRRCHITPHPIAPPAQWDHHHPCMMLS